MRINNRKKIEHRIVILLLFLFMTILSALLIYILKIYDKETTKFLLSFCIIVFSIYLIYKLLSIKYFYYEYSGEVISIKYYPPWKKGIIRPSIELPKYLLKSFDIQEKGNKYELLLSVMGSKDKIYYFKYNMVDLSNEQIVKMRQSLQQSNNL